MAPQCSFFYLSNGTLGYNLLRYQAEQALPWLRKVKIYKIEK
jgi:hypothetical protein